MLPILIVDDASFMRLNLKKILFRHGYTDVVEATNGEEALLLCMTNHYLAVFMDISMPVLDGISALEQMRLHDLNQPVIIVSAEIEESIMKRAVLLGVKGIVMKPFKEAQILEAIRSLSVGNSP